MVFSSLSQSKVPLSWKQIRYLYCIGTKQCVGWDLLTAQIIQRIIFTWDQWVPSPVPTWHQWGNQCLLQGWEPCGEQGQEPRASLESLEPALKGVWTGPEDKEGCSDLSAEWAYQLVVVESMCGTGQNTNTKQSWSETGDPESGSCFGLKLSLMLLLLLPSSDLEKTMPEVGKTCWFLNEFDAVNRFA